MERRNRIDLHTHTTASDGMDSPVELVMNASRRGIAVLGITDHDAIGSLNAAAQEAEREGMTLVPGVELNTTTPVGEVHILGYFVDTTNTSFVKRLEALAGARRRRIERIIARLHELGYEVNAERILAQADRGSVGRPHVAAELIRIGVAKSVQDAFDRFIGENGPAYVPREAFSPEEAVAFLAEHRAIPVLAHPFSSLDPVGYAERLIAFGLRGIETYYAEYSAAQHAQLRELADRLSLIPTGGSDYHGVGFKVRRDLGAAPVPIESFERLAALAEELAARQ